VKESRLTWIPVNDKDQETTPYKVSKTYLELQDESLNLDQVTLINDEALFKVEVLPTRPYTKDFNAMMDVTIEMNSDLVVIQRNGYTIFDLMSDTGGVQSILFSSTALLIGFFNYQHFDTYMASKLFKLRKPGAKNYFEMEFFSPSKTGNLKEFCQDFFGCSRFCRKNPRARMI